MCLWWLGFAPGFGAQMRGWGSHRGTSVVRSPTLSQRIDPDQKHVRRKIWHWPLYLQILNLPETFQCVFHTKLHRASFPRL